MWSVLLSSLRPVRRHASQLTTLLASNNIRIGSRGYTSNCCGETVKQHLYVVLDDHKDGFGVHMLDLGDNTDNYGTGSGTARRLPEPPFFRVTLETLGSRVQFATVGSSIVAMGTPLISPELKYCYIRDLGGILIYNTKTTAITVAPYLPTPLMRGGYKPSMAIGNSLYILGCQPLYRSWKSSLYCLTADPVDMERDNFWGWEPLSDSSPWCWSSFSEPPILPFFAGHVTAHAIQTSPSMAQHEILMSVRPTKTSVLGSTFSFSTESNKWRQLGRWHLPVVGQAHYDVELDAWVGLHAVNGKKMYGSLVMDGHLCFGKLTSTPSQWKEEEESEEEEEEEYMLMSHYYNNEEEVWGEGSKCLLRLAFFRVKGGQDGEPVVTACRPVRYYEVCRHNRHFDAQLFWM
ncbi:unnamed protein product [Alopecurus aequalis]